MTSRLMCLPVPSPFSVDEKGRQKMPAFLLSAHKASGAARVRDRFGGDLASERHHPTVRIFATLQTYRRYASVAALLLQRNAATRKV